MKITAFQHQTGTVQVTSEPDGSRIFTYFDTDSIVPYLIRRVSWAMMRFQYEQLTNPSVHYSQPVIDAKQISYGSFMQLIYSGPNIFLPEYTWAVSSDGNVYHRQIHDIAASTQSEIETVRNVASQISERYSRITA